MAQKIKDRTTKHNKKHFKDKIFTMKEYEKCPVKGCNEKCRKYRRRLGGADYRCSEHGGFFVQKKVKG